MTEEGETTSSFRRSVQTMSFNTPLPIDVNSQREAELRWVKMLTKAVAKKAICIKNHQMHQLPVPVVLVAEAVENVLAYWAHCI